MSGLRWLVADSLNHVAHFMLASKLDTLLTSGRVTRLIEVIVIVSYFIFKKKRKKSILNTYKWKGHKAY